MNAATQFHPIRARHQRTQRGLTLIELMIALVLGLLVLAGVISVVLANSQTYRTNEALSELQESARTAFELLARDIRQAGLTGCNNTDRVGNVLNNPASNWWSDWTGIRGYDGNTAAPAVAFGANQGQRIAGTHAIQLQGIQELGVSVVKHNTSDPSGVGGGGSAANFQISQPTRDFQGGEILIVCDFSHATIFQVASYDASNTTVRFHAGGSVTPGNCSKGLGFPTVCTTGGTVYEFGRNSSIGRFAAVTWYIGNNGRAEDGGRSLYRVRLGVGGQLPPEEIVAGVSDMELAFRQGINNNLVAPTAVANWANVNAVELTLELTSASRRVSTDPAVNEGRLQRDFTTVVGLRNRIE